MKCLLYVFFLVSLLVPASGWAQPPLRLQDGHAMQSARAHLEWLPDASGRMTPQDVMSSSRWQALPGGVSAGYTADAVWVRLRVVWAPDVSGDWVLRLTNSLLDDVRLYRRNEAGDWQARRSGEVMLRSNWEIDDRSVVLPLKPGPAGQEWLLLRLQSKNAMSTAVELWPRATYDDASRRDALSYGLYFGCYLLLILFHAFFWRMTREAQSGWYLLYVSVNALTEMLTVGLPQQVFDLPMTLSDPLLGLAICSSLAVGLQFTLQQLELPPDWRRYRQILLPCAVAVSLISAALVLSGQYAAGVLLVQRVSMVLIVLIVATAVRLLVRGHRPARFFLLAFGIFYAGVLVSYLRNMGLVPPGLLADNAAALGTMIHMVMMSLRLNSRYDGLRREKEQAQAEAVRAVRALNESLEDQVAARTTALRKEISRRERLEQELRQALEMERRIKEEQQDFVAMVSHEFRTPLAIISTTAQQIAKNLDAAREKTLTRCRNLREATGRMTALVDEYLTVDRMDAGSNAFRPALCQPGTLLESIRAEWPAGRVALSLRALPVSFACDAGLLRVALRNLLANADRHAPAGDVIHIQAEGLADGRLQLTVCNGGEPIPAEETGALFQKYFRGRQARRAPGAGLGLYLVQRIAAMHGGEVALTSDGSQTPITFRMLLPGQAIEGQRTTTPA